MPEATVIQLYGTGDADNIANVDMPDDGTIISCHISGSCTGVATDTEGFRYEVSFGATSAMTTNDARAVIARASYTIDLVGAAANVVQSHLNEHFYYGDDGIKIFGGERIYLHGLGGGNGLSNFAYALLVVRFQKFTARRR